MYSIKSSILILSVQCTLIYNHETLNCNSVDEVIILKE